MHYQLEPAVTASDKTFLQLRNDIVEGVVTAGSKLNEAELASSYSVSRAVVREAINRLEACHLIERKAHVGARVVALSAEGLLELYQVREALEGMAARLAAQNMTDSEVKDLKHQLTSYAPTVEQASTYYQQAGNDDFHFRIILGSHNSHLISILLGGIYHLVRMYRVQLGMAGPRVAQALIEHNYIIQAIANRDAELAEILMRRHIQYTQNDMYENEFNQQVEPQKKTVE